VAPDGDTFLLPVVATAAEPDLQPWRDLCSDAALRLMDLTQRMSTTLDVAMRDQPDPDVLDTLYALDALTCQSRRIGENLFLLSGRSLLDTDRQVTSLIDIIHAALGRIAGWQRVTIGRVADIAVAEYVSGDLIRVMTELLDNAARYSPRTAPITASGHLLDDGGVLLRVEDAGIGITVADLEHHNALLRTPNANGTGTRTVRGGVQQGLQVVRRAVSQHGIRVTLTTRLPRGATAQVYVPAGLLCEIPGELGAVVGVYHDPPLLASDRGWSAPGRSAGWDGPGEVPRPTVGGMASPSGAASGTPGQLPTRIPQRMRDAYPAPPVPVRRRHLGPGAGSEDAVDQIVAFDAATGGTVSPADPEGASHDDP
jgi:anti-sigma regulatory factor (Ser/Thr protein kinase)